MATESRPLAQKTVGVLGGMSDQATIEYYRAINARLNQAMGGWDNGEIIVVSVNFGNIEYFVRHGDWSAAALYLNEKIDRLERAGADLIICVSNTVHRVVAPLMEARAVAFLHIVDPTGAAIARAGLKRVGLLGTAATMNCDATAERFKAKFGLEILTPPPDDQTIVNRIIFEELVRGDIRADSKHDLLRIATDLRRRGAEGVVLGCSELFLSIDQPDFHDFPVFDTTQLHIAAAADWVLNAKEGAQALSAISD